LESSIFDFSQRKKKMSKPSRVALVGCGHRGMEMLKLLLAGKDFEVSAFVDDHFFPSSTYVNEFSSVPHLKCAEFWKSEDFKSTDLVMIASVNNLHTEHIYYSLSGGKFVFCEKPLYTPKPASLEWCEFESLSWEKDLKKLIRENSDRFCTGFVLRHSPFYKRIKVELPKIGKIMSGTVSDFLHYGHGALVFGGGWRHNPEKSGGHVVEKLVHIIDLLCWYTDDEVLGSHGFTGPDMWIRENKEYSEEWIKQSDKPDLLKAYSFGDSNPDGPFAHEKGECVESSGNISILFKEGASIGLHFNTACPESRREFFLVGTQGTLHALWTPSETFVKVITRGIGTKKYKGTPNHCELFQFESAGCHGGGDQYIIKALHDSVLGKPPNPSPEEALRTMTGTLKVQKSLQH
jgi:predicted dehydrogenase